MGRTFYIIINYIFSVTRPHSKLNIRLNNVVTKRLTMKVKMNSESVITSRLVLAGRLGGGSQREFPLGGADGPAVNVFPAFTSWISSRCRMVAKEAKSGGDSGLWGVL